jgi:molybdenum cofactor guanylyltransferase
MGASGGLLGLVLAGGPAERMSGIDKAGLDLGGERLLARALRRLGPQVSALAVSTNGDPCRLGTVHPVLPDAVPGGAGPLAGVVAGLDHAAEEGFDRVLTLAVDTPFFPEDFARRMEGAEAPVVVAATETDDGLRWHGACALWPVSARAPLRAALLAGERDMRAVAERLGAVPVTFAAPCAFFNINTPEDLTEARDCVACER